jgi:hypothetical protein
MSDFDEVLERLVNDATFAARLAADPDAALAGYRLEPSERELLGAQLDSGPGADRTVEMRTSKSGVIGLLGPVVSALSIGMGTEEPTGSLTGIPGAHEVLGEVSTGRSTLGELPVGTSTLGDVPAGAGTFGEMPAGVGTVGELPAGTGTLGDVPAGQATLGVVASGTGGPSGASGTLGGPPTGDGAAPLRFGDPPPGDLGPITDYHTNVDARGDGHWDAYRAFRRPDGGVDVEVSMHGDGRVDFIGHDTDGDGIMESADVDNNDDGQWVHLVDTDGDGWMDAVEPPR